MDKDDEDINKKTIGENTEEGNNNLSDNEVKVAIDPDVKANKVDIQICSCSLIFNGFAK